MIEKMKKGYAQLMAALVSLVFMATATGVSAAPPTLDVSTATTYLDTEVGAGQGTFFGVAIGLAAASLAIGWLVSMVKRR